MLKQEKQSTAKRGRKSRKASTETQEVVASTPAAEGKTARSGGRPKLPFNENLEAALELNGVVTVEYGVIQLSETTARGRVYAAATRRGHRIKTRKVEHGGKTYIEARVVNTGKN